MRSKTSKIFAWVFVFILVLGLAGFGIQDVLRSSGTNEVATFGNQKISSDDYVRMIQQETRNLSERFGTQLSFSQAQSLGVAQVALQKLISSAILDQTVQDLGFSQSDIILKDSIQKNPAFGDIAGRFDSQKYREVLLNVNLKPTDYEGILRKELARNLFLNLTSTKFTMDRKTEDLIAKYMLEERFSDIVILTKEDLDDKNISVSSSEIKEFYDSSKDLFTQPETKKISYIHLSPTALAEKQTVSAMEVEDAFLLRKDNINTPEKRDVDQMFFNDEKLAKAALISYSTKALSFEKVLKDRGLTKDDVSLGEITESELPALVGETIFLNSTPSVIGPVETELGFAIYRVNRIIPEVTKTLGDVYDAIKNEIAIEKATNDLNDLITLTNDEIAAGSTLEDIAKTTEMIFGTLNVFMGAELPSFANTPKFRVMVRSAKNYASDVQFDDEGGIFSLRIDKTLAPFVKDLSAVEELAQQLALAQKIISTLGVKANKILQDQKQSGRNLLDLVQNLRYEALKNKKMSRFDRLDNLPDNLVKEVFSLSQNEAKVILGKNKAYIVQLREVIFNDQESEESISFKEQIRSQFIPSLEQDMVSALIDGLETNHTLYINQKAVDIAIARFN